MDKLARQRITIALNHIRELSDELQQSAMDAQHTQLEKLDGSGLMALHDLLFHMRTATQAIDEQLQRAMPEIGRFLFKEPELKGYEDASTLRDEFEALRYERDSFHMAVTEAHRRLDAAGVPTAQGAACGDPTCQTKLGHRVKVLIERIEAEQ